MSIKIRFNGDEIEDVVVSDCMQTSDNVVRVILPDCLSEDDVELVTCDSESFDETDDDNDPAWVGADGGTTKLSAMKDDNVLGLYKKFKKHKVDKVFKGWFDAIKEECEERDLDTSCTC